MTRQGVSLQPPDPVEEQQPAPPKWYSYWPPWRRIMMTGALILLVSSLVIPIMGEDATPEWLGNAALIFGYGFLAWGFFKAMRARSDNRPVPRSTGESEDGSSGTEEKT